MYNQKLKPQSGSGSYIPFVGLMIPFVGNDHPLILPFIGKNIPFVCNKHSGLTLIELIITLTVVGILAAIAVPGMRGIVLDHRLSAQANEFLADLGFARSEAIRRGTRITICKTSNPTAASPACDTSTGNPWTTGRVIYIDGNTVGTIDGGDVILRIKDALDGASSSGNRMLGDSIAGDPVRITYMSTGLTDATTAGETQFRLCDNRGNTYGRAIVLSNTGRARIAPRGQAKTGALSCS